jgi:hypothetical protein
LVDREKPTQNIRQMAIHHRRCENKTPAALSITSRLTDH